MEKAVLNIKTLNVTQGMNGSFSHNGELAIDIGGACEWFKAPFTGTIKRIYANTNTVWLESNEKVLYADGTIDYMTIMTHHDNDISDLYVGKVIKQGEVYYHPGVKGYATGSHIHMGVGRGKFVSPGWYKGQYQPQIDGYAWPIYNQYDVTKALFLYDKINVQYAMYDWKKTSDFNTVDPKPTPTTKYKVGDVVEINGVYISSTSDKKLVPAITKGTITRIIEGARNPYLLDDGNIGWVNNDCIISNPSNVKYLNLNSDVSSWTVYKTNNYYIPSKASDVLAKLNPAKFGGLSYKILEDCGNYHFKIKTAQFGEAYIAGNPNKYSCTITDKPIYSNGNY